MEICIEVDVEPSGSVFTVVNLKRAVYGNCATLEDDWPLAAVQASNKPT
jgi:hypothetical protein